MKTVLVSKSDYEKRRAATKVPIRTVRKATTKTAAKIPIRTVSKSAAAKSKAAKKKQEVSESESSEDESESEESDDSSEEDEQAVSSKKKYVRPAVTYRETLTKEDIIQKLRGYKEIEPEDLVTLPERSHIRYIKQVGTEKPNFVTGGFLLSKGYDAKNKIAWLRLHQRPYYNRSDTNVAPPFSAQIKTMKMIWVKMTYEELYDIIDVQKDELAELKEQLLKSKKK